MKPAKSLSIFLLTICIVFTTFLDTVEAKENALEYTHESLAEQSENAQESVEEQLEEFLTPFYEGKTDEYIVYDVNEQDITDVFFSSTEGFYNTEDWEAIKDYYYSNVGSLSRYEDHLTLLRSGDRARTETRMSTQLMSRTGEAFRIRVSVTLRGTIYYNPNTYAISDTRCMVVKVTSEDLSGDSLGIDPYPADYGVYSYIANSRTGKFGVSFEVYTNGFVSYGNFNYSFNMSGN